MRYFLALFLSVLIFTPAQALELHDDVFDVSALGQKLEKDGLEGEVHGSAEKQGLYVFTYRDKASGFFKHIEMNLIAPTSDLKKDLAKLKRHDFVKIQGKLLKLNTAQPHISLSSISVVKEFKDPERAKYAKYKHKTDLSTVLKGKTEIEAIVHAVAREDKVFVVEYGDAVIPVVLTDTTLVDTLYRGDKVRIQFTLAKHPKNPTHIVLDETAKDPLVVLEPLVDGHSTEVTAEGELIYFPISPQISVPVFAIRVEDKNGTSRNYTLLNFDPDTFKEIREACMTQWKKYDSTAESGRNYLINHKLRVKAKGTSNVVDRSQANPQIILEKASDMKFSYDGKDI